MLEIYNEQVFDLLQGTNAAGRRAVLANEQRAGLRIRNHPQKGFYGRCTNIFIFIDIEIISTNIYHESYLLTIFSL